MFEQRRYLTSLGFGIGFVLVVHGAGDHLEDAVDGAAVQPDVQRSHHQPLDGRLLDGGHHFLHIRQGKVLGVYENRQTIQNICNKEVCDSQSSLKPNEMGQYINIKYCTLQLAPTAL